jgi:hypothetical protein
MFLRRYLITSNVVVLSGVTVEFQAGCWVQFSAAKAIQACVLLSLLLVSFLRRSMAR